MWYNNGDAYALLQLQELEPHAWLTGAWQEPDEQSQLAIRTVISGMLLMKKVARRTTSSSSCSWLNRKLG
jgi:hypothetical protein